MNALKVLTSLRFPNPARVRYCGLVRLEGMAFRSNSKTDRCALDLCIPNLKTEYLRNHTGHENVGATNNMCVGRTHTIVRLQTRIRRKDGTENFGGFVYVLGGFPQRDFVLWLFTCPINISLFCVSFVFLSSLFFSLFSGYHAEGYHAPSVPHGLSRLYHHCTATTLVSFPATTP